MVAKRTPNAIDLHVGGRLRMRRVQLGMSQEKLGDALELTFQQVQKYEKGANRIGASRLVQIARVLEVEPEFFFDGAPASAPATGADGKAPRALPDLLKLLSTNDGIALAGAFMALEATQRGALLHLAKVMAGKEAHP